MASKVLSDRELILQAARRLLCAGPAASSRVGPEIARAWESGKELHCEALAVNVEDIPARQAVDARKGLRVAGYDQDGCPVFTSKRDYREYRKSEGCHFRGTHYRKRKRLGKVVIY